MNEDRDELTKTEEISGAFPRGKREGYCKKHLEEGGFLVKVEPLVHNVGSCYRCKTIVEPRLSKQWFVKKCNRSQTPRLKRSKTATFALSPKG